MAEAAKYRLFELNPVTNEWIDRGWVEGSGQQDVIRKSRGDSGGEFFVVPQTSYHPVKVGREEVVKWTYTDVDGTELTGTAAPAEPEEVDA
jgi:hypothetical protein